MECDPIALEGIAPDPMLDEIAQAFRNDPIFRLFKHKILEKIDKQNINANHHPMIETGSTPPTTTLQSSGDRKDTETSPAKQFFGLELKQIYAIEACEECQSFRSSLLKETLKSDPAPTDAFLEIFFKSEATPTSKSLISSLLHQLATFGRPLRIISDGGLQFTAAETQNFFTPYSIAHRQSSPHLPQYKGLSESAVNLSEGATGIEKHTTSTLLTVLIPTGFKVRIQYPTSNIWYRTATVEGKK
ncbi:unnamed protein product [Lepeophtheirus salmonis]|uniref:(salmon louse) hypothetical protein n=1 Tax=Lepeophtheirus salmonis TaxID=72036 RepID=A0A7R8CK30_LEPSM|nr:unnamed protein product [Lepeophtheirus salmonis]CAF2846639.1 unnamed protein product [Lepeophtheirus salmonis]